MPDELVAQGNEVVERQYRGQIQPGAGRRRDRDAVDVGQLAGNEPHAVARDPGPADSGQFMGLAEVDGGAFAQPWRQPEPGQHGRGFMGRPGTRGGSGENPGPFDDLEMPAGGQVDEAAAVGQILRPQTFGRDTQRARLIDGERCLGEAFGKRDDADHAHHCDRGSAVGAEVIHRPSGITATRGHLRPIRVPGMGRK